MKKKCITINLRKTNQYIFLVFLGALSFVSLTYTEGESKFFDDYNLHPIIYTIAYSLGLCLSFIFLIIAKILNKRNSNNTRHLSSQNDMSLILSNFGVKHVSKKEKYLWILLVSIIDLFSCILNCIYWVNLTNYFNSWATTIIALTLLAYWRLKMKLFKHHYISIIIIVIIGLLYNYISERFEPENIKNNYMYYIMFSLNEILFSLTYVLYKYMMHIKYIKFYEILFYEGLIFMINDYTIINYYTNNNNKNWIY